MTLAYTPAHEACAQCAHCRKMAREINVWRRDRGWPPIHRYPSMPQVDTHEATVSGTCPWPIVAGPLHMSPSMLDHERVAWGQT